MPLLPGDPAPTFKAATRANPTYSFHVAAGRYLLLAFVPADDAAERAVIEAALIRHRALFDDAKMSFFGALRDGAAFAAAVEVMPGIRWFDDADLGISRLYGMVGEGGATTSAWVMIDPSMRILGVAPISATEPFFDWAASLPPVDHHAGCAIAAPVLILPRVFEPDFCRVLIGLHREGGAQPSGFMREIDGRTVLVSDREFKRREDYIIEDEQIRAQANLRILRRMVPEIAKAFRFTATRIERYLVACYDGADQGAFRPHRDNTTKGTAHRQFAVTINLNADDYDGGDLRFPEYGSRTYRAPTGGAVVFSCGLLHEATPVTRGRRYAFLPFLYDEAAAQLRERNLEFVDEGLRDYRAGVAQPGG